MLNDRVVAPPLRSLRVMMKRSCNKFRDAAVEHDSGDDALCQSRTQDPDPDVDRLRQYTRAAVVNAWEDIPQPARSSTPDIARNY